MGQRVETADGRTGRVLGGTDPELHSIAVATWLDASGVRDTVAHELGHYLLLGHGPGIMAQRRDRDSTEVAEASISEFAPSGVANPPRMSKTRAPGDAVFCGRAPTPGTDHLRAGKVPQKRAAAQVRMPVNSRGR